VLCGLAAGPGRLRRLRLGRGSCCAAAGGAPIEEIARLAGHNRTATTELVYRHELRPVITTGAEVMDRILNASGRQNRS